MISWLAQNAFYLLIAHIEYLPLQQTGQGRVSSQEVPGDPHLWWLQRLDPGNNQRSIDSRNNLHDNFHDSLQVLQHQVSIGAKGITAVMGPPVHSFPPLFRQNGPYSKYRQSCHHWWFIFPSDLCINRQARPAYRCNMKAKRPYCFKVNAIESEYVCRSGELTCLGFQQMLRGSPPQHRGVLQGLGQDGAHTLRGWLHLGEVTH